MQSAPSRWKSRLVTYAEGREGMVASRHRPGANGSEGGGCFSSEVESGDSVVGGALANGRVRQDDGGGGGREVEWFRARAAPPLTVVPLSLWKTAPISIAFRSNSAGSAPPAIIGPEPALYDKSMLSVRLGQVQWAGGDGPPTTGTTKRALGVEADAAQVHRGTEARPCRLARSLRYVFLQPVPG